ncbi:GLPGLI family protein [Elizabethkingia anophelis]|nr:GLPGLI family protein [Elizabethkingia anophelis]
MKKILLFIPLLLSLALFSQESNNLEIDYKFSKRISKTDTIKENEIYRLFINNDYSYYISDQKFKNDSIRESKNFNPGKNISLFTINELIVNDRKSSHITTYKYIAGKPIGYEENLLSNWKMTNKTKTNSLGILLSNAEIEFGGRKWSVWFSSSYPINEGPYKFKNLPGLVFEVNDSENIFKFEIVKIKKIGYNYTRDFSRFIILPKQKFIEVLNAYANNPLPELTKMLTPEGKNDLVKKYIQRYKNAYYLEKDYDL